MRRFIILVCKCTCVWRSICPVGFANIQNKGVVCFLNENSYCFDLNIFITLESGWPSQVVNMTPYCHLVANNENGTYGGGSLQKKTVKCLLRSPVMDLKGPKT